MVFALDHRLDQSSSFIEDWELCRVCLKTDKTLPWLYLVPRVGKAREIFDLSQPEQAQLAHEMARAAKALELTYKPEKINTAALGNMVPQLHVHVFCRFRTDPAWPRPIWAVQLDEIAYTAEERDREIERLKACFSDLKKGVKAA